MIRRIIQLAILTAVITTNAEDNLPAYRSVLIGNVPHIQQKKDFCGEASAEMYLRSLGENIDQDYIFDRAEINPMEARGLFATELASSLSKIGFDVGPVWTPMDTNDDLTGEFEALHTDLLHGIPSIVCMHTSKDNDKEHFRLVLGYDATEDAIIYHEPSIPQGAYQLLSREKFLNMWALQGKYQWGTIRIRLEAKEIEYGDASTELTAADYAQHLMELESRLPDDFAVRIEKPFIIVSDCTSREIDDYSTRIVRKAVSLLKKDFFLKDPDKIIEIWMFKDSDSYRFHTLSVFGHEPDTPYGYYSAEHNALILDISTGGGTLVHEIVHPFIHANFPTCPPWFDEGIASLFERPTKRNGHIKGLVNWRLPGLKESIRNGEIPSIHWLTSLSEEEFYGQDPGTNYAQARYLCYYLQEKGVLVDYYHALYENRNFDKTGFLTIKEVLSITDTQKFENEWANWVLTLNKSNSP